MPSERKARFVSKYGLSEYDARILVTETALADFYEAAVAALPAHPKPIANWMTGELLRRMREENVGPSGIRFAPDALAALVRLVESGKVSGASAKAILVEMWQTGGDPEAIVNTKGLLQVSDEAAIAPAREPPGPDDRAAKEDQARCEQQHPDQGGREERDAVDVVLQGDRRRGMAREVHAPDRRLRERRGAEDRGRDGVADDCCHKSPEREAARSAADEEHEERGEADVADRRTEDARGEMAHQEPGRGGEGRVPREIGLRRRLMVEGAEKEQNCP